MEKSSSAFRTISEVADELAVPKHVLRFWEGKFPQLRPMKRGGGRRYYRPEDVDLLRGIRWLLYSDGYTIKGVQRILRDSGVRFVKECWREDLKLPDRKAVDKPLEIPNLAAEVAREAGRATTSVARVPKSSVKTQASADGQADAGALGRGERAALSSVLRELEECRDALRGTGKAPSARPSKKPKGEQRRGLDA